MSTAPIRIRRAGAADAAAIARVHVASWQAAYRGLLPDDFLDGLSVERREVIWQRALLGEEIVWVAEEGGTVVAFSSGGACRDGDLDPKEFAEIYAIYCLRESWGRGIGRAVLEAAMASFEARGNSRAVIWVLEANRRAREFYRKAGFVPDGATRMIELGGGTYPEVRYVGRLEDSRSQERKAPPPS